MAKLNELKEQVAELEQQVEGMGSVLREMGAVTVVFGPDGQVLQLTGSDLDTAGGLLAARVALRGVSSWVEERVVAAQVVEQVKAEAVERLRGGEAKKDAQV